MPFSPWVRGVGEAVQGLSVGVDRGSGACVGSSCCASAAVAWAAYDVDVVEADGLAGGVAVPRGWGVVDGEVVGCAAVGAPGLQGAGAA